MRGTVVEIDDDDVVLEIADGVQVALRRRSAIAAVKATTTEDEPRSDDERH